MRKLSYFVTFLAVFASLTMNAISTSYLDWFSAHPPEIFGTTSLRYGLYRRCEVTVLDFPVGGHKGWERKITKKCREFPLRSEDKCETTNRAFCTLWWSAGYSAYLSAVFGAGATLGIIFGASTRSRRRRVWTAVVGLVALQAAFKIVTFGMISHVYRLSYLPAFEYAAPGFGYVLYTFSWIFDLFVIAGVVTTGLSAKAGYTWAAGNRSYSEISG